MKYTIDARQRELFWDVAKALAIFCVIWGHTVCNLSMELNGWLTDPVNSVIIHFHMPLFMFISGYFAFSSLSRDPWITFRNKARQLLLPSLTWFIVLSMLAIAFHRNLSSDRIKDILTTLPVSYWFLKALFLCYVITIIGAVIYHWHKWGLLLYILLIGCFAEQLNYVSTISMLPFFLLGLACNKYRDRVFDKSIWLFSGCSLIFISIICLYHTNNYNIHYFPFKFDLGGVRTLILRIIVGFCGSLAILIFLKWLVERCASSTIIRLIGKVGTLTLGIYCIQAFFAEGLFKSFAGLTKGMAPSIYFYVLTPLASLGVVLISVVIIKYIKKSRWLNFLLLGEKLKQ